jgi:hypothetical protein
MGLFHEAMWRVTVPDEDRERWPEMAMKAFLAKKEKKENSGSSKSKEEEKDWSSEEEYSPSGGKEGEE